MTDNKQKKRTSWLFVYAAMFVAVVFATQSGAKVPADRRALSPVIIDGNAPLLNVEAVVRRADL